MAISKITLNGVVQMDLTSDTVTAQTLVDDYVAHGADGNTVTGELVLPTARTASDVTVSGATVTIPSGAYASQVQKSVASGTAGTPTASKGTVSNHAVTVTPSVTNTTGYITGGTKTGTAVTVTASELASGNKAITQNGSNIDVVGYSTVSVDVASSGASNALAGTFTTGAGGSAYSISISDYTGSGFPVLLQIGLTEGAYNSSGTAYNTIHQYGITNIWVQKVNGTTPTYGFDESSSGAYQIKYKSSTTVANTLSGNSSNNASEIYSQYNASSSAWASTFKIKQNAISVYVSDASGTRGLLPNTEYYYSVAFSE